MSPQYQPSPSLVFSSPLNTPFARAETVTGAQHFAKTCRELGAAHGADEAAYIAAVNRHFGVIDEVIAEAGPRFKQHFEARKRHLMLNAPKAAPVKPTAKPAPAPKPTPAPAAMAAKPLATVAASAATPTEPAKPKGIRFGSGSFDAFPGRKKANEPEPAKAKGPKGIRFTGGFRVFGKHEQRK